jgi:hypothetical protein
MNTLESGDGRAQDLSHPTLPHRKPPSGIAGGLDVPEYRHRFAQRADEAHYSVE